MHMADALISPLVGGVMLAAAGVTASMALKKLQLQRTKMLKDT